MRIIIKGTQLDLTPAIKQYIEDKIGGLEKFMAGLEKNTNVDVRVEIARTTKHHNKGEVYYAEANIDLPNNDVLRAAEEDFDVRLAIDKVKDALQRELKKWKAKSRPQDSGMQKELRKLRGKD